MSKLKKFSELVKISPNFLLDLDIDKIKTKVSKTNVLQIREFLKNLFIYFEKDVYNYNFQNHNAAKPQKVLKEITSIIIQAKENCKYVIDDCIFDLFLKEMVLLINFVKNETKNNFNFAEHVFMKKILRIQKILILMGFDPILDIPIKDEIKLILYIGGSLDEVMNDKQAITDYNVLGIITWGIINKCIGIANSVRQKLLLNNRHNLSLINKNSFAEILCPNGCMDCSEYFRLGSLLYLNYIKFFRLTDMHTKMYLAVGQDGFATEKTVPLEIKYLENSEKIYDYYRPHVLLLDNLTQDFGELEFTSLFIPDVKINCTLQEATDMSLTELKLNSITKKYSILKMQTPQYFLLYNKMYKENIVEEGFFNKDILYLSNGKAIKNRIELLDCLNNNKQMFLHLTKQSHLLLNFIDQKRKRILKKHINVWKKSVLSKNNIQEGINDNNSYIISKNIKIKELIPNMSNELYDLIDKNREHLKQHLVWVDSIQTPNDELKFIKSVDWNNRKAFVMQYENKTVGIIDYTKTKDYLDIGYWIAKDFEGKGIVTQCCKKVMKHAFLDLKLNKVTIHTAIDNPKSEAVAKRLGFKFIGIENSNIQPHLLGNKKYEMLAKDFRFSYSNSLSYK